MSFQINHSNGSGPLARVVAFLVSLIAAFAIFGFGAIVWVVARLTGGQDVGQVLSLAAFITKVT